MRQGRWGGEIGLVLVGPSLAAPPNATPPRPLAPGRHTFSHPSHPSIRPRAQERVPTRPPPRGSKECPGGLQRGGQWGGSVGRGWRVRPEAPPQLCGWCTVPRPTPPRAHGAARAPRRQLQQRDGRVPARHRRVPVPRGCVCVCVHVSPCGCGPSGCFLNDGWRAGRGGGWGGGGREGGGPSVFFRQETGGRRWRGGGR